MNFQNTRALLLIAACAALPATSSAQSLQSFAGVVGGPGTGSITNGCTTYSAPAPVGPFFGSAALSMQVLGGNGTCNYQGGWSSPTALVGPLVNTTALGPTLLGNLGYSTYYSGTADARSNYGALGAKASGLLAGDTGKPGNPSALFSSMSAGFFTDALTFSSPSLSNQSNGFVRYSFALHGTLSALGTPGPELYGQARAQLNYQHGVGPINTAAAVSVTRGGAGVINNSSTLPSGWTSSVGLISGSSIFLSGYLPIVLGQTIDLKVGLMSWAYGTADADFFSTATLSNIELFDANQTQITQFSVAAASGTTYPGGTNVTVPEPSTVLLMLVGMAGLMLVSRRSTRGRRAA